MAVPLFVGLALGLVNLLALIRDREARGIRPYLGAWLSVSNAIVACQLFHIGQVWSAAVFAASSLSSGASAALIACYQWRKKS